MDEELKHPGGRPSAYRVEFCQKLIEHMAEGLSFEAFAGAVGVRKQTLYNWEKEFPEFLDAKEVGLEMSRLFWEQLGIKHIINKSDSSSEFQGSSQSKSRSLNASVYIFNMKNRFGWRDKQPGEVDVVVNNVSNMTDDQIEARAQDLIAKTQKSE